VSRKIVFASEEGKKSQLLSFWEADRKPEGAGEGTGQAAINLVFLPKKDSRPSYLYGRTRGLQETEKHFKVSEEQDGMGAAR